MCAEMLVTGPTRTAVDLAGMTRGRGRPLLTDDDGLGPSATWASSLPPSDFETPTAPMATAAAAPSASAALPKPPFLRARCASSEATE